MDMLSSPHWGMVIDLAKCVGCDSCTVACKAENRTPPGISYNVVLEQETGTYPNVRIEALPRPCMQCENPACVSVCPVKATYRGEDGIVVIDADRCIGCKYCIAACPYGARSADEGSSYTVEMQAADQVTAPEYGVDRGARVLRDMHRRCAVLRRLERFGVEGGAAGGLAAGVPPARGAGHEPVRLLLEMSEVKSMASNVERKARKAQGSREPQLQAYALPAPFSRRATVAWAVIVGVLLAAGAFFMLDRLANGLGMAGATNAVPWGLWVVVYIWFSGLAGVLALRYVLVVAGFSVPLLAGMPTPVYVPSLGEVMVALFVLGLAVGCYGLAVRLLPLERMGASEGEVWLESAYTKTVPDADASSCGEGSRAKEVRDGSAA